MMKGYARDPTHSEEKRKGNGERDLKQAISWEEERDCQEGRGELRKGNMCNQNEL